MINTNEHFALGGLTQTETGYSGVYDVPANLPYFEGHFPGEPILPAIGVIDASLQFLRCALDCGGVELKSVVNGKFAAPIRPGAKIKVEITPKNPEEGHWVFLWCDQESGTRLAELSMVCAG